MGSGNLGLFLHVVNEENNVMYFNNYRFASWTEYDQLRKKVHFYLEIDQLPFWDEEELRDVLAQLAQSSDEVGDFAKLLLRPKWDNVPAARKVAFLSSIHEEDVVIALANSKGSRS